MPVKKPKKTVTNWSNGPFQFNPSTDILENYGNPLSGHTVTIVHPKSGTSIVSLLLEQITYNITADWTGNGGTFSKLAGDLDSYVNGVINTGVGFNWVGSATRKYYNGGSTIAVNVKIRLVEGDFLDKLRIASINGKLTSRTPVVTQMAHLNAMALPSIIAKFDEIASMVKSFREATQEEGDSDSTAAEENTDAEDDPNDETKIKEKNNTVRNNLIALGGKAVDTGEAVFAGATETLENTDFTVANNPGTVRLYVGNWFNITEGVVTSITFTPSRELTINGPLYCDVQLQIETRENPFIGKNGDGQLTMGTASLSVFQPGELPPASQDFTTPVAVEDTASAQQQQAQANKTEEKQ
jgi:hypothetical protein